MVKKNLKWLIVPVMAAMAFVGFNSFSESSESDSSGILGEEKSEVCPKEYDILRTTETGTVYGAVNGGDASIPYKVFQFNVTTSYGIRGYYKTYSVERIQTERVLCPGWKGFCTRRSCGQEL